MRSITFKNKNNEEITLSTSKPYIITNFESGVNNNIYSNKGINQDGSTYENNNLDTRDISLELFISSISVDDLIRKKSLINKVFNPKLKLGTLIYKDNEIVRTIDCMTTALPYFKDVNKINSRCLINLQAFNPFFKGATYKAEIAIWRGAFEFPLEIVDEGIEMGYREPSLIVNVFNTGDVACGMKIQFKALATVVNPSLFNVNTREYFKINKSMEAGEVITVTTHFQNKRVEINKNGVTSTLSNWDLTSTFLQLDVGDNLLRYDADEGLENLEVNIYYTPQYLGV